MNPANNGAFKLKWHEIQRHFNLLRPPKHLKPKIILETFSGYNFFLVE
jgi:hypothetical protein